MRTTIFVLLIAVLIGTPFVNVSNVSAQSTGVPGFLDLFPVESVTGYLVTQKMPTIIFPLNNDFFYQYFSDELGRVPSVVRTYELTGVEVGYKNLYLAPDPENAKGFVRYTVFYHTQGTKLLAVGMYDRGSIDKNGKYIPSVSYYSNDVRTGENNPDTEHSVLGDFYPNKLINDLEVAIAMLDYQNKHGPFIAGQSYSLLEIMDFKGRAGYVPGKTSSGSIVPGGGACVMATNMMKLLTLNGDEVLVKWGHPSGQKYFENPFGAEELPLEATDATVAWPNYDLRWVQKETGWIGITAALMTDGKHAGDFGDEFIKFEALELITFRFSNDKPDLSTDSLVALKKAYKDYRAGDPSTEPLLPGLSRLTSSQIWTSGDDLSMFLAQIAPEERISRFKTELTTDPFLKNLVELRAYGNTIDPSSQTLVGDYLITTPWYKDVLGLLKGDTEMLKKFESALRHLNSHSNSYSKQKIQCYGFVVLLWGMDSRFAGIGGVPVIRASGLVPDQIRNGEKVSMYVEGMWVKVVNTLDDVNVGDLGVRYNTATGHVFAVVGKKVVDGQTVLLIASANQAGSGKISIFEVDSSNFDAVFGSPPYKKTILRTGTK